MTKSEARQKVLEWANSVLRSFSDEAAIMNSETITKSYGWVFIYDSRKFLETGGDNSCRLAGNGPVVVLNRDGSLHPLGTAYPVAEEIAAFEHRMSLY